MPDEEQQAASQETDLGEKPDTDAGTEDKGESKDEGQGGKGTETKTGEGVDKAKAPTDTSEEDDKDDKFKDDGKEPSTKRRMSSKDFIIQRQKRKIDKLREDKKDDKSDDDDVAPEDEALITKVIAKKFAPFIDRTQVAEDKREIAEFLIKNPDFKPFEAKAKRYIAHPSRRHLPIEAIFYEVAGKALLRIGAKRQTKADEEARQTQTGGGAGRSGKGGKGVWDMSKEEFEAKQEEIRRRH